MGSFYYLKQIPTASHVADSLAVPCKNGTVYFSSTTEVATDNFTGLIGKRVFGTAVRNSAGITGTVVGAYVSQCGSGSFIHWDNRTELRLVVLNEATDHIEEVNLKFCKLIQK